ncbi:MAG: metal-dependent transcriptional regulator [Actinomycetota bacterium]|nr:MAG: metal-dependent transcriptional regulator [Actinomycetota bacterium]
MTKDGLSPVAEDYLRLIWKAEERADAAITTNQIATILAVAPSSVSGNLARLARAGLIEHEPYGRISLSESGRQRAVALVRRHRIIETYLVERFGYGWDEVDAEAEVLEHAVSDRLVDRMDQELGHPTRDPHGDPIPGADGTVHRSSTTRLNDLPVGAAAQVDRVSDHSPELLRYLGTLGIGVGAAVTMLARRPFADTYAVGVQGADGHAGTVELAASVAAAIQVTPS